MSRDRTVLVRLRANADDYIAEMERAKAATTGVGDAAKKANTDIDKASRDGAKGVRALGDEVDRTSTKFGKFRTSFRGVWDSIDTTNDRMAWMAQGFLAIGPALAPIGASVVPALSALAAGATVAAGSVTALMLAFNGVGDAMGALNDYQLEPTAQNLAKVQQAMADLSPAGQDFVFFLDEIGEQLSVLQGDAQSGMFPGMMEGIDALMERLPQFRTIISEISEGIGTLTAEAGQGLGGEKFDSFFSYLESDAQPILLDFGRTMGNFAEGLANMMVEMGGLTSDFSGGLLEMSRDFAEWSRSLDQNQSFQDFLDYVSESGPKVMDLLGALTETFVDIVRAAAPVGDVMLPMITKFVEAIGALADSPVGHLAVMAAAITAIIGRFRALSKITSGGIFGAFTANSRDAIQSANRMRPSLRQLGTAMAFSMHSAKALDTAMASGSKTAAESARRASEAKSAIRGYAREMGPAAMQAGLFAVAMSPIPEKMGMTGTAMGAMIGSMAGPWGAALGAAGGAVFDFMGANDKMVDSLEAAQDAAANGASWDELTAKLEQAQTAYDEFNNKVASGPAETGKLLSGASLGVAGLVMNFDELSASTNNWLSSLRGDSTLEETEKGITDLEAGMTGIETIASDLGLSTSQATDLLDKLGYSAEEVGAAAGEGGVGLEALGSEVTAYVAQADSVEGRTNAVGDAIANLGNDAITTADSASQLAAALEALLSPEQSLIQSQDAWTQSLRNLNEDLAANRTLVGKSDAAIQNRAAISQRVTDLRELMSAMADAGAGPRKLANVLANGRKSILEFGEQAGMSRKQLREFLNQIGLTPKMVTSVFKAAGIDEAEQKARNLADQFRKIPKSVVAKLRADPGNSDKIINNALKKLDLTKKERRALITIRDKVTPTTRDIIRALNILDGKTARPQVKANTKNAEDGINRTGRAMRRLANQKLIIKPETFMDHAFNGLVKLGRKADDTGRKRPRVQAGFVDNASRGLGQVETKAKNVGTQKPKVVVSMTDNASSGLNKVEQNATDVERSDPKVTISATDNASGTINAVRTNLTNLNGDEAVTYITTVRRERKGKADGGTIEPDLGLWPGGTVPGSRLPYGDKVTTRLAPGEEVITNRNGEADRNRAELKAANAGAKLAVIGWAGGGTVDDEEDDEDPDWMEHLANGGTVGRRRRGGGKKGGKKGSKKLTQQIKNLSEAIDDTTDSLRTNNQSLIKSQRTLDAETKARQDLVAGVTSALEKDIWAAPEGSQAEQNWNSKWAGGAAPMSVATVRENLIAQRNEANQFNNIMRNLIGRGLSGGALAEISAGGLERARMFANMNRTQIAQFENLYNSTQRAVATAASRVGDTAATTREIRRLQTQVSNLNKTIRDLDKKREKQQTQLEKLREKKRDQRGKKNAKSTGRAVGDAVRNSAKRGRRNRR